MKKFFIVIFICTIFFALYTLRGIISLDSDFGWHIRMGQIVLKSGIPKTDPFSYTMPSYPFVDHEWLTNVIIAILHPRIGMFGLSILCAVCVIGAFILQVPKKFYSWSPLLLILIYNSLFSIGGVRTQVIAWVLFSVLLLIIRHYKKNFLRFGIPILIFVWANLHGSFPIGLGLLFIFYATRLYAEKNLIFEDICIFVASAAVTFINPYGYRLWWEVWMQMSDGSLHWAILEWLPTFLFVNIPLWFYVVISTTLFYRYYKKMPFLDVVLYLVFLLAGISSYRHMPFWMLVSIIPTIYAIEYFYEEVSGYLYGKDRFVIFNRILLSLALISLLWDMGWYLVSSKTAVETKKYPATSLSYIKSHLPQENIFTIYEWGGYFDWKLPEKKVFIDGRMPSFRWSTPHKNESNYVFKEYQKGMFGTKKDFNSMIKKYKIQMVVMPRHKESQKNIIEVSLERLFDTYFSQINKTKKPQENKFEDLKIVYQDQTTIIYLVKNKQ